MAQERDLNLGSRKCKHLKINKDDILILEYKILLQRTLFCLDSVKKKIVECKDRASLIWFRAAKYEKSS